MTTTPTLTGHARHRILDDLWAVTGLGEYICSIYVTATAMSAAQVYDTDAVEAAALQVALDVLDESTITARHYEGGSVHLRVTGSYRGVPLYVHAGFDDPASRDLIRTFDGPDARLLAALVGDRPDDRPDEAPAPRVWHQGDDEPEDDNIRIRHDGDDTHVYTRGADGWWYLMSDEYPVSPRRSWDGILANGPLSEVPATTVGA